MLLHRLTRRDIAPPNEGMGLRGRAHLPLLLVHDTSCLLNLQKADTRLWGQSDLPVGCLSEGAERL